MKILFLVSDANAHGGTEILAYNLIDKLKEKDVQCFLLSRWQYKGEKTNVISFSDTEFRKWARLERNPLNKLMGNIFSDRYFKKVFFKIAEGLQVDWVINHTYDLVGAIPTNKPFKSAQIFNWSIVGYEKNLYSAVSEKPLIIRMVSKIALSSLISHWHKSLSKIDRLVVLSEAAQREIQGIVSSAKKSQVAIISDPIMFDKPSSRVSSLSNKRFVYVGRLSQEKGVMRLLRIWERLYEIIPEYSLDIYGDGHLRDEMVSYIQRNHLKSVNLKGFSSDLESIYTNADLCLMTSDTEGFGMVLIEAMYYGVPCISFDCPVSPKEIIDDAGITIPCFDEEAYAAAVVDLVKDGERLKRYQRKAVERAKDFYIDKVIEKWLDMLYTKE